MTKDMNKKIQEAIQENLPSAVAGELKTFIAKGEDAIAELKECKSELAELKENERKYESADDVRREGKDALYKAGLNQRSNGWL